MTLKACVIFSTLGPNPAPLTELVWKLARSERFDRFEIHVVVEKSARHYLDLEVLAPGAALSQLRGVLRPGAIESEPVVSEARSESLGIIDDDAEPEALRVYGETVWSAARQAVASAGARPVMFGLVAGRRRTMTALESAVFQLLARPQDLLVDVRVTDPRVEGGTGFFFPEQPRREVKAKHSDEVVDVGSVDVNLVELDLPRLRPFVPESALVSLARAREATEISLLEAAPPKLSVDLDVGGVSVDGEPIHLFAVTVRLVRLPRREAAGRRRLGPRAGPRRLSSLPRVGVGARLVGQAPTGRNAREDRPG